MIGNVLGEGEWVKPPMARALTVGSQPLHTGNRLDGRYLLPLREEW